MKPEGRGRDHLPRTFPIRQTQVSPWFRMRDSGAPEPKGIACLDQTDRKREKEGAQTVLGQEGMTVVIGLVERSSQKNWEQRASRGME